MSGHWRFRVAAFLLLAAGLATSPAVSNPLEDLLNPAPKEAAAPAAPSAPARAACLSRPGSSAAPGQHWFYRVDGHRKCWYQGAETRASLDRRAHRHAVRQSAAASDEDEPAPRRKTVADARAQMLVAAPADAAQPPPPAPEATDSTSSASAPANQAATRVAAPVVIEPPIHQVTPERAAPRSVDVEMLLADSSLAKDTAASSAPAAASAKRSALGANEGQWETMVSRAGMALITLGFIFLIGSLLVSRFREPRVVSSASFLSR